MRRHSEIALASLVLLACAGLQPVAAGEWLLLSGAGSEEVNGVWERIEDCNSAPQYEKKVSESRYFELFLHLGPLKSGTRDAW